MASAVIACLQGTSFDENFSKNMAKLRTHSDRHSVIQQFQEGVTDLLGVCKLHKAIHSIITTFPATLADVVSDREIEVLSRRDGRPADESGTSQAAEADRRTADRVTFYGRCLSSVGNVSSSILPGHPDLSHETTIFEDAPEHKLVHLCPNISDVYCPVSLRGERVELDPFGRLGECR